MTTIVEQLVEQLRCTFEGPAWHGPSVQEAITGVTATEAAAHPISGAHSIWELALHLSGAYRLVLRRLEGDDAPLLPLEDWPIPPSPTTASWSRDVASLHALNREIRAAVARFPAARLFEPIVADPPYSAFTQFVGLTQHDLYHAGQVVLLRRALGHGAHAA